MLTDTHIPTKNPTSRARIMASVMVLSLSFLCLPAAAMNLRATTRADHKSLDCVVRRLDRALQSVDDGQARVDVMTAIYHLKAMRERRGGAIGFGRIELGSEDEAELICAQYGYANSAANLAEIRDQIKETILRWIWSKIVSFLWNSIPWTPVLYLLWTKRKKIKALFEAEKAKVAEREEEQVVLHKKIDEIIPDKNERRAKLDDPRIRRAHQRMKEQGAL